jgi:hypothetical protein
MGHYHIAAERMNHCTAVVGSTNVHDEIARLQLNTLLNMFNSFCVLCVGIIKGQALYQSRRLKKACMTKNTEKNKKTIVPRHKESEISSTEWYVTSYITEIQL